MSTDKRVKALQTLIQKNRTGVNNAIPQTKLRLSGIIIANF